MRLGARRSASGALAATMIAGVALFAVGAVGSPAAQASEYWNDYGTTLPKFITAPTPFTVTVDGPSPVCSMTYRGATLSAGPWNFTYDPSDTDSDHAIDITTCDGETDQTRPYSQLPFGIEGTLLQARSANQVIRLTNETDAPARAALTDARGTVLATVRIEPRSDASMRVDLSKLNTSAALTVAVSGDEGLNQEFRVLAAKGYKTFFGDTPTFTPCSTVTWGYDARRQPKQATTFLKDIKGSLARIARETGLRFRYTDDYANAQIRYHWDDIGSAGMGGTDGDVAISTTSSWPRDHYAGFGPFKLPAGYSSGYGPGGRGWLIIHETLHVLGFDHVSNPKSVMASVNKGQHSFDKGTLDGMHAIYQSKCS